MTPGCNHIIVDVLEFAGQVFKMPEFGDRQPRCVGVRMDEWVDNCAWHTSASKGRAGEGLLNP